MAVLSKGPDSLFLEAPFRLEAEFEALVVEFADAIFGPTSIYVDIKKRIGKSVLSIPDAYVIDMADPDNPQLFVIENEIESHDPFRHIGFQMLRFVTSFEESRKQLRDILMETILADADAKARLEEGFAQSSKRNIDNYLDEAVYAPFRGIVVIDHAREELFNVLKHINADFNVLEFQRYGDGNGEALYRFDTLYEDDEVSVPVAPSVSDADKAKARKRRAERRAKSDTIVVPAQPEGFERTFIGKNCWYAIRIGAAMRPRLRYIAAYQIRPISAVTHIAEIERIEPYEDTGKFIVYFKESAEEITHIPVDDPNQSPQSPVYCKREDLMGAKTLDEVLT